MKCKLICTILLLSSVAFGVNRTVKAGGGGTCTAIQTCLNLSSPGDTVTVFVGTYTSGADASGLTIPAGTAGNYVTLTVNGDDLVTVLSIALNSYNKVIGGATLAPTTTGLHVENPSSPATACMTFVNTGETDIHVSNTHFYACNTVSPILAQPYPDHVFFQNNTFTWIHTTSVTSFPDVGTAIHAYGDHWLVEGNNFSHVLFSWDRIGSFGFFRNNKQNPVSKVECSPTNSAVVNTSGHTITYVSGIPLNQYTFIGTWVAVNGTQYTITGVGTTTLTTSQALPTLTNATLTGGNGGNCHFDFAFNESSSATQNTLVEANNVCNSVGDNNKFSLWQADSCRGQCFNAIVRFNIVCHIGGGFIEDDFADTSIYPGSPLGFYNVKVYNNTALDINNANLTTGNNTASNFISYSQGGAFINNLIGYDGNGSIGMNTVLCDSGQLGPTCTSFIGLNNLVWWFNASGTNTLFGYTYNTGSLTGSGGSVTNINQDPQLVNYAGGDYHLNGSSPAFLGGTNLTTVSNGCNTNTLVLTDATFFSAGDSSLGVLPDVVSVGTVANTATISSISSNTVVFTSSVSCTNGDKVWLKKDSTGTDRLTGSAPNIGALGLSSTFVLTVTETGTGNGTVTSDVGTINCPGVCNNTYNSSTVVTLTAVAGINSAFTGWSGGLCTGTGTCVVTMNQTSNVTATFTDTSVIIPSLLTGGAKLSNGARIK